MSPAAATATKPATRPAKAKGKPGTITAAQLAGIAAPPDLAATVSRDDLAAALRWATSGMRGTPIVPVLRGALLHATNGALHVTTFDYEQSAAMSIVAAGASGYALVEARALVAFLHVIPRGCDVRLTIAKPAHNTWRLVIQAGEDLEMSLATLPVAEWPSPPEPGPVLFTTTGERLASLARVCRASGRDDTLPVLTGVHIECHDGHLVAAATDRYRLAVSTVKGRFPVKQGSLLVPANALARLGKAFAAESEVVVHVDRDATSHRGPVATFVSGSRVFHTRLIDGEFPKYRSLMEHAIEGSLTAPAEALRVATRQAAAAVRGPFPITMHLGAKTVMEVTGGLLNASTGEPNVKAKVRGITYDGPKAYRVGVNAAFMADGLAACGGETVHAALGPPNKPLTLTDPDDDSFSYLLMPVRLAE